MHLYLIRHPHPEVEPGLCYGRSDLSLIEDATICAARIAPLLPAAAPVYSSPLKRCRQLADALSPTPYLDPRLMELDFGAWEMLPWDAISPSALDAWAANPLHFKGHGGESAAELRARVAAFLDDHTDHDELVLVTHGGVMKACASLLLGLPTSEWMAMPFELATVTLIGKGRLLWHNRAHGS